MTSGPSASAVYAPRFLANAALACLLLGCGMLVFFPPSRFSLYPQCPIHEYFGILCPGCGATRALAALLRGYLFEALRLNALFVLLLPFALFLAVRTYIRAIRHDGFYWPRIPTPALAAILIAAAAFTLVRNLPR